MAGIGLVFPPLAHLKSFMKAFKPRSPPEGGGAGCGVASMSCLGLWLDFMKRRAKRILANQGYLDKFYPHSILTITIQLNTAYDEVGKFARIWCNSDSNLDDNVLAVKEIFEVENKDDMTWMAELLSNKHAVENIDKLIYLVSTVKR